MTGQKSSHVTPFVENRHNTNIFLLNILKIEKNYWDRDSKQLIA